MALNNNLIELKRELTIYSILGVPYQFYPNMFYDYTDNIAPSTISFLTLTNCTDNGDGSLTPTGSPFSFRVNSASGILITVTMVGTSIQKPNISISRIKSMLGTSINNLQGLNTTGYINYASPIKPNSTAPHSLSEWINYFHNAQSGCYITQIVPSSSVDFGAVYTVGALAGKMHGVAPSGYSWGNSRVDIYKQGSLIQTGTVNNLATSNYTQTNTGNITNSGGGLTSDVEHSAKFYLWNGSSYVQQGSDYYFYVRLRGNVLIFSYQTAGFSVKTLSGNVSINNQTSSSHTYVVRFQLKRSGSVIETKTVSKVVGSDSSFSGSMPVTFTNTLLGTDTFLIDINQDGGSYQFQSEHPINDNI